jgi:hypothetical protein
VSSVPYYQLVLSLPQKVFIKLEEVERKYGIKKEDIVMRALTKVLYEEYP